MLAVFIKKLWILEIASDDDRKYFCTFEWMAKRVSLSAFLIGQLFGTSASNELNGRQTTFRWTNVNETVSSPGIKVPRQKRMNNHYREKFVFSPVAFFHYYFIVKSTLIPVGRWWGTMLWIQWWFVFGQHCWRLIFIRVLVDAARPPLQSFSWIERMKRDEEKPAMFSWSINKMRTRRFGSAYHYENYDGSPCMKLIAGWYSAFCPGSNNGMNLRDNYDGDNSYRKKLSSSKQNTTNRYSDYEQMVTLEKRDRSSNKCSSSRDATSGTWVLFQVFVRTKITCPQNLSRKLLR